MGLTDTWFVSKIGENELAAGGISNSVYFTTIILGLGIAMAVSALSAKAKGQNNPQHAAKLLRAAIIIAVFI